MGANKRFTSQKFYEHCDTRQFEGSGFRGGVFFFVRDDAGAVTVDWVSLTAGILVAGMMAIFAIYGNGVSALTADVNTGMTNLVSDLDPGTVVQQNP